MVDYNSIAGKILGKGVPKIEEIEVEITAKNKVAGLDYSCDECGKPLDSKKGYYFNHPKKTGVYCSEKCSGYKK